MEHKYQDLYILVRQEEEKKIIIGYYLSREHAEFSRKSLNTYNGLNYKILTEKVDISK
jgi:hypothetical protein